MDFWTAQDTENLDAHTFSEINPPKNYTDYFIYSLLVSTGQVPH